MTPTEPELPDVIAQAIDEYGNAVENMTRDVSKETIKANHESLDQLRTAIRAELAERKSTITLLLQHYNELVQRCERLRQVAEEAANYGVGDDITMLRIRLGELQSGDLADDLVPAQEGE
jgi:hypothetical protein